MKRIIMLPLGLAMLASAQAGLLDDLAKPQQGRSMRATSTMRVGEVRRGGEEKLNPKAEPLAFGSSNPAPDCLRGLTVVSP